VDDGSWSLARHGGYIKGGNLWRGADLPRGVFIPGAAGATTRPISGEGLLNELTPNHFAEVTSRSTSGSSPTPHATRVRGRYAGRSSERAVL
jgi:hypothetical protein